MAAEIGHDAAVSQAGEDVCEYVGVFCCHGALLVMNGVTVARSGPDEECVVMRVGGQVGVSDLLQRWRFVRFL
jgi:hypothetical protein